MHRFLFAGLLAAMIGFGTAAFAAERTQTLDVDMFCATCPYIVKTILERVEGVRRVDVSYRRQTAVVTYNDDKVDVAALVAATTDAGFASKPGN